LGRIELTSRIRAPRARCFDLARSVDLHQESTAQTGETAIAGVTTGLLGDGQEVTWRARHLGVWQTLTSKITAFAPPTYFRDSMVQGAFARFDHDHYFEVDASDPQFCIMRDVFDFDAPLGPIGRLVSWAFLDAYMRKFLVARNELVQRVAESDRWQKYLPPEEPST
jgi:ligand-binding SRPBCC domain-containing protein